MSETAAHIAYNRVYNIMAYLQVNNGCISESDYQSIGEANAIIAEQGDEEAKEQYCSLLFCARINTTDGTPQHGVLGALEYHFRSFCAPLFNELSSFITTNGPEESTQSHYYYRPY